MATRQHYPLLDAARVIAAVSIVYLHTVGGTPYSATSCCARFAVPFFAASAVFLAFRSASRESSPDSWTYFKQRVVRIYLPFLIWSLAYGAARGVGALAYADRVRPPMPELKVLWTGTVHHLWFLPFVLIATVLTYLLTKAAGQRNPVPVALFFFTLALATALWRPGGLDALGYTVDLSYRALPAVFLTLGIANLLAAMPSGASKEASRQYAIGLLAGVGFVASVGVLIACGRVLWIENLAGVLLLFACLQFSSPQPWPRLSRLGQLAFGVYLVHVFFIEGGQDVLGITNNAGPAALAGFFGAGVIGSLLLCLALARLPFAWVLGLPALGKPDKNRD